MKKKLYLLLFLFLFTFLNKNVQAQVTEGRIYFSSAEGFFKVQLASTSGIAAIKVRLGESSNYELVDYTFAFDVNTGLPTGYSYSRNNLECILGIGTVTRPETCFGEIVLQDTNGNWGTPYQFISN